MASMHKIGQGTLDVLEAIRRGLAPVSDRVLDRLAGPRVDPSTATQAGMRSFEQEADAIMSTASTHRAQTLVRSAVVVTVVLIVWASLAKVDEVTKGEAKVIPSRQLQIIQSLDGGVVSEILVKEGQVVEAGQLLLKIDETRATSGVRESAAQAFSLKVKAARLKALAEGNAFAPPDPQDGNEEEARKWDEGGVHRAATGNISIFAGCDRAEKAPPQAGRPVQVVKVEASLLTAGVELSGEIQAEKTVSLSCKFSTPLPYSSAVQYRLP